MKAAWIPFTIALFFSLATDPGLQAGRININLTNSPATGTGSDGNGALGGGTWNRINSSQADEVHSLFKSDGGGSTVMATNGGAVLGDILGLGNAITMETWGLGVTLRVTGLLPNQPYKIVVYSDRHGTGPGNTDDYVIVGASRVLKSIFRPGLADSILPGTENVDYLVFLMNASVTGDFRITAPYVAGIQIEGVLDIFDKGPQVDCRISKRGRRIGGKGNGLYRVRSANSQSVTQRTSGRRAKRYYVNVENDGNEVDNCVAMAFFKRKQSTSKVIDRDSGRNVTTATNARNYRFLLCKGETRRFKVIVKPKSRKRATINVGFCGSPSTRVLSRRDCSTCVLKVK